jgi:thiamine biosynthesis lipoprotein
MMSSKTISIINIFGRSSLLLLLFYLLGCESSAELSGWSGMTMGTTYQVKIAKAVIAKNELKVLRSKVDSALTEVNHQMSTYDPGSEISAFNKFADTTAFEVSKEFVEVVKEALDIYKSSGKAFDVTVAPLVNLWGFGVRGNRFVPPTKKEIDSVLKNIGSVYLQIEGDTKLKKKIPDLKLDLSAIAKGYGVDVVARVLSQEHFDNFMVEIGGEVFAQGEKAGGNFWKIGIDTPHLASLPGQHIQAILSLKDVAVATSGDYRNYFEYDGKIFSHTIDPYSGFPVTHNLASVTIIAKNCMEADALATALMVMGKEEGIRYIETLENAEAFLIVRKSKQSYETFQSSGFGKYLVD